mmetsp:Transcript_11899/g.17853  ORF Transcript_11899/g.17853 Transcript_11899/m.17853 type:complete len:875 (+) Transcript_11899:285-2909(+)
MATMVSQDSDSKTQVSVGQESAQAAVISNSEGKRRTITEFVEAKFAACEQKMRLSGTIAKAKATEADEENAKLKNGKKDTISNSSESSTTSGKTEAEEEDEEAYATFTYLMILTAVYLPFLLFLWIRRNVFGTASLVRSLFLGHMLRFGVAFMLLPPSTIKAFLPARVWNFGIKMGNAADKFWNDKRTQAMIPNWVHVIMSVILGVQTDTQAVGGGALEKAKSNGPPLSLMGLGIFTVLAFLVNPDGLTWILIGRLRGSMHTFASQGVDYVQGVRNGTIKITLSEISTILATAVIIVTIVNSIRSNWKKNNPQPHREKANKQKNKKGKKGRGRNNHQGGPTSSHKNKIRGGHFRSTKEMFDETRDESPPRSRSLSPSPSELRRARSLSDTEGSTMSTGSDAITAVLDVPKIENMTEVAPTSRDQTKRETQPSVPKLAPVMQIPEDDKSCSSSVATVQTNTTDGGSRKKNRMNKGKRGLQKSVASAPSTPRGSRRAKAGNSAVIPSLPAQDASEGKREHSSLSTIKKNSDEKNRLHRDISRKNKEEAPNRSRSFTSPEVERRKPKANAEVCAERKVSLENHNSSPIFVPCVQSSQLKELAPLAPVGSANNLSVERIRSPPGLGIENPNMLNIMNQNFSLENQIQSNSRSPLSPAKMELHSFLSRICIEGSIFVELMMDLDSLDSFALLTDSDYIRYGIRGGKKAEIMVMLEGRKLNMFADRARKTVGWNCAVVRPPPGLNALAHNAVVGGASSRYVPPVGGSLSTAQSSSLPYFSSTTSSVASTYSLTPGSSMSSFSMPLGMPQNEGGQSRERASTLESGRNLTLPPISPIGRSMPQQLGFSPGSLYSQRQHNDEEIEADLQELGGQMAGSILDF